MPASMARTNGTALIGASARVATAGPGQSPAMPQPTPKKAAPAIRRAIEIAAVGEREALAEQRAVHAFANAPGDRHDSDRAAHDEGQRRVPLAEQVEEAAARGRGRSCRRSRARRRRWRPKRAAEDICERGSRRHPARRSARTVKIPAAIKVAVATRERWERRLTPHTPWPLVQPLPSRVPKPTSNPATTSIGQELKCAGSSPATRAMRAPRVAAQ